MTTESATQDNCPTCDGRGWMYQATGPTEAEQEPCEQCEGTGKINVQQGLTLTPEDAKIDLPAEGLEPSQEQKEGS